MNLSTAIILLVLIFIVSLIIYSMVKEKKAGMTSCGTSCGGCHKCQDLKEAFKQMKAER